MSLAVPRPKPGTTSDPTAPTSLIPPLESGDRLSRDEFERRYDAMPQLKKAELIEGVVYVASPVRHLYHGRQDAHLLAWLVYYEAGTPGVETSGGATVRLDLVNEPQPDGVLFVQRKHGGQATIDEDGYIAGAVELAAEVAASSASYDLHDKLNAYRRNGVCEYIVWRVYDRQIDWFVLREGRYEALSPESDGTLRSTVFPGLWLDPASLMAGNFAAVLAVLDQGLKSAEHAEFAARLAQA